MEYEVIESSSSGNCVIVGDVMVDIGVGFNRIKKKLYDIKVVIITHVHSDHVKRATYDRIRKLFPHITIVGNWQVHQDYGVDVVSNPGFDFKVKGYTFTPFKMYHDVECHGYSWEVGGERVLFATDTYSLKGVDADWKYDYLFIEANHDVKKVERARNEYRGSYNPYLEAQRHLSVDDCRTFYYLNRKNEDSVLIELHRSSRFY